MSARRLLGPLLAVAMLVATGAVPAEAAGPSVRAMVVGRSGKVVAGVKTVRLNGFRRGRCRIRAGLPLGALRALRVGYRTRGCGGSLYVSRIGRTRARRQQGWVYKVNTRNGTAGAANPSGPFGNGRVRSGSTIVWFYCYRALRCQRTLKMTGRRHVRRGGRVRVRVRGYDDFGRSKVVRGATVTVGGRRFRTNRRGLATLRLPRRRGVWRVRASRRGTVPAFPIGIRTQ